MTAPFPAVPDLAAHIEGGTCLVESCGKPSGTRGLCGMHYTRLRRHGSLEGVRPHRTFAEAFDVYCPERPADGCWEWKGNRHTHGYGIIWAEAKHRAAHRYSYEQHNGPIPRGLHVRHTCDNPPCVNPTHLLIGTPLDNARDKVKRERQPRGSKHGIAVLNEAAVIEIRRLVRQGVRKTELAAIFGVNKTTIGAAVNGKTWQHVPDGEEPRS